MTELSTKTSTDDSRIGSHSAESPTMTTSCEVASEPKMVCGEVGAQLRVSIDHSSCPSARDLRRLIDAGNEPGGNRQAIPGIDGRHRQRQGAQLLLAEVRSDSLVAVDLRGPESGQMKQGLFQSTSLERSEEHTSELQSHSDLVCR